MRQGEEQNAASCGDQMTRIFKSLHLMLTTEND